MGNTRSVVLAISLLLAVGASGSPTQAHDSPGTTGTVPDFSLIGFATESGGTTGGVVGGKTTTVSTAAEFVAAAGSTEPLTILVSGTLDLGGNTVKVASNKTITGQGKDAGFVGNIMLEGVSNIIMRNLTFTNPAGTGRGIGGGDGLTARSSHHVWVDHCNFGDCTDGQFDITHGSDFFTVSWCKFSYTNAASDHRLSMLIGNRDDLGPEDEGKLHVTLHHNWVGDLVYERAPRVRFGQVHIFNTYYAAIDNNICIGLGISSQVLLESTYFDGIKRPWKSRSGNSPTPGRLQCNDDIVYVYDKKIQMGETSSISFKPPYTYKLEPASTVKETVMKYAGVGKGPFGTK
jgi:pectate lyase